MTIAQTSLEAYHHEVYPTLGLRQLQVLKIFQHSFNPEGLTNMELSLILNWSINRITPRVFELRRRHLLYEECTRLCSVTGRKAKAWRLTKTLEKF